MYWRGLTAGGATERPTPCRKEQLSNLVSFVIFLKREGTILHLRT